MNETTTSHESHSLQTYVSDMLALERHIGEPLDQQSALPDATRYPEAARIIEDVRSRATSHIGALERCLDELGGHAADPVKSAWSGLLGIGAKAVNAARKTKISKALRDDYAALALASVSYEMLYATAVGLGETSVAELARRHLTDYARSVMEIGRSIPSVVLQELADDGEAVATDATECIRRELNEVWRSQAEVAQP
jgi:ferritin-like metal-binding protein YciE